MIVLIVSRCKLRSTCRKINTAIVLIIQIITVSALVGIGLLYYRLEQSILSDDLASIKYANLNLCSDGVLAHALLYYASYVMQDVKLI